MDDVLVLQVLRGVQAFRSDPIELKTQGNGGILKYPKLIKTVCEEEAMLEDKRKVHGQSPLGNRVASVVVVNSYKAVLKVEVSKWKEMVILLRISEQLEKIK